MIPAGGSAGTNKGTGPDCRRLRSGTNRETGGAAQAVHRRGLYRLVRHPSYLGMEIIFLAAGLHAHNWVSLAVYGILPTLALLYRIHVEEAALLHAFGQEYADYMRATRRLIPWLY